MAHAITPQGALIFRNEHRFDTETDGKLNRLARSLGFTGNSTAIERSCWIRPMPRLPAKPGRIMLQLVRIEKAGTRPAPPFRLSCVVPAYNEAAGIDAFLQALSAAVAALTPDHEIIVVNDGSSDDTGARVLATGAAKVRCIELSRNFGKEIAIQAGLDAARGDCVVILDADFQHPVELIAGMVERWQAGAQMVYAVRADRARQGWLKRTASAAFYRLLSGSRHSPRIPADAGDFRLLDRKVVLALRSLPERDRFMKGLYAWVGFRSEAIEFMPAERASGDSKFGVLQLASLAVTGLTSFSNLPLRWVTGAGVLLSTGALAMATWLVVEKLWFGQPIAGFATIGAAVFFFSGVQLLGIGIVGEYVGRIFNEVKQRPRYLVAADSAAAAEQEAAARMRGA
jgi:polyisoprenyl-phosphate glycosyltransferase